MVAPISSTASSSKLFLAGKKSPLKPEMADENSSQPHPARILLGPTPMDSHVLSYPTIQHFPIRILHFPFRKRRHPFDGEMKA
jgi:hypothetical protein